MNPFTALFRRIRPSLAASSALASGPAGSAASQFNGTSAAPSPAARAPVPGSGRSPAQAEADSPSRPNPLAMLRTDRHWNRTVTRARAHLRQGQWMHYRDTRLEMAAMLRRRGLPVDALALYLDVWYLDLNGPRDAHAPDAAWPGGGALLDTEDPPFSPARAQLRSPARRAVRTLMYALDLRPEEVQTIFFDFVTATHRSLALPLAPAVAWQQIGPELLF